MAQPLELQEGTLSWHYYYRHPHWVSRLVIVAFGSVLIWDLVLTLVQISTSPW